MTAKQEPKADEHAAAELVEELKELHEQRDVIDSRLAEVERALSDADIDPEQLTQDASGEDALRAELEEWQTKYQRALADFQNFQRRSIDNEAEARKQGVRTVVDKLLNVLDNFDLALAAAETATATEQILSGVTVIRGEMFTAMQSLGLARITPEVGDEFDPQQHEAMTRLPAEGINAGDISATLAPGYTLKDRVLRPAKVAIAPEPASSDEDPMEAEADPDE
jgi:molecular chaperone GrpE